MESETKRINRYSSITQVKELISEFTWKIENFELVSKMKNGYGLINPTSDGTTRDADPWLIKLYPNGNYSYSENYLDFDVRYCVHHKFLKCSFSKLTVSIIDKSGKETHSVVCRLNYERNNLGEPTQFNQINSFIKVDTLIAQRDNLLPEGTLTLRFQIYLPYSISFKDPFENESKFIGFENMLNKPEFSDVKVNVSGREIFVYKGILASKSPVFAAMFSHDMQESNKNIVNILDISYDVIYEIFFFMYTGKVKNIRLVAKDLLIAAEKYQVKDLKLMCEKVLAYDLNNNNVIELLILAEQHKAETLKKSASDYMKLNFKELINIPKFQDDLSRLPSTVSLIELIKTI